VIGIGAWKLGGFDSTVFGIRSSGYARGCQSFLLAAKFKAVGERRPVRGIKIKESSNKVGREKGHNDCKSIVRWRSLLSYHSRES
jgi:hypothetical protein